MSTAHTPAIVELNLLPKAERPAEVSPLAIAFAGAVLASIAALIPLSMQAQAARSDASAMKQQANTAEAGLHGVQVDLARQRAMRADVEQAKADLASVTALRDQMQGGSRPLNDDLIWLYGLGFLTPGMKITAVTGTVAGFRVDGDAPGPLDAIAYAEKLSTSGGFPAARVAAFTPAAKGGQFSVEVTR